MIGLVNAAGMSDLARVQAAEQAPRRVFGGIFLPIQRSADMVGFRVLRSAIEHAEFSRSSSERKTPDGEESDRFDRADVEAQEPAARLGRVVDVTA